MWVGNLKAIKHSSTTLRERQTKQAAGLGVVDAEPVPTGERDRDKEHECNFILIRLSGTECQLAHNTSPKITIIKYFYLFVWIFFYSKDNFC